MFGGKTNPHLVVFGFGVRFDIWYVVSVVLIGTRTEEPRESALWVVLVTVSILLHELGHAWAFRRYGAEARITLGGLGGLTHGSNAEHLSPQQRIKVSLAGPLIELVALGLPAWILRSTWDPSGWAGVVLSMLFWINVVWALVNLAPVWPMDGGQIMGELLFLRRGGSARVLTHRISLVTGAAAGVVCWVEGLRWGTALFVFFVVVNLFGAGILRTRRGEVMLWEGVTTRGSPTAEPRWRPPTRKERIDGGYRSLELADASSARSATEAVARGKRRGERREARELLVWASLAEGRRFDAAEAFGGPRTSSKSLAAVMVIENGEDERGLDLLCAAVWDEAGLPVSRLAIIHSARSAHAGALVERLLERGTAGLGHAVRVQQVLEEAGMTAAAWVVEAKI